ncbi:hypothetical protein AB0L88_26170 [Saccharopolyspora shandongensis]|uniref:hypothetical protein n=1 Tax=Saccharopolyspora shandongensis TaxID=418495 RepID=UPI00342E9E9F
MTGAIRDKRLRRQQSHAGEEVVAGRRQPGSETEPARRGAGHGRGIPVMNGVDQRGARVRQAVLDLGLESRERLAGSSPDAVDVEQRGERLRTPSQFAMPGCGRM